METSANQLQRAYDRLARVYDFIFGALLQSGRATAVRSIPATPGLRVLELGIGTGLTLPFYSPAWKVVGVDLSPLMLAEAQKRMVAMPGAQPVRLVLADGGTLPFADEYFDVVLAPYVMSVVPDAVAVGRELRRVCKASGRIIIVNHFLSESSFGAKFDRWMSPLTARIGFRTDLSLRSLLSGAGLRAVTISKVNIPAIWTLVSCVRDQP
jgi:phosphatidylethanolamine/phosphatidyl-N-methylethanolamine N-methyltransferase